VSDNITLPRAVIKRMRSELYFLVCFADTDCGDSDCEECEPLRPIRAAIAVFDAALAAPEPEPTVKESLTVDAALAEPDDAEALRRENERLREALKLALNSHGRMLMSDPPQDPWKVNRVDEVIRELLQEVPR
jgi:hypothetical protein